MPFDKVAERFGAINAMLDRNHMVTTLCVLDAGTAWYSVESGRPYDADFMTDRRQKLILQVNAMEPDYAFYRWYVLLASHLTRSILSLSDVFDAYGSAPPQRSVRRYLPGGGVQQEVRGAEQSLAGREAAGVFGRAAAGSGGPRTAARRVDRAAVGVLRRITGLMLTTTLWACGSSRLNASW